MKILLNISIRPYHNRKLRLKRPSNIINNEKLLLFLLKPTGSNID